MTFLSKVCYYVLLLFDFIWCHDTESIVECKRTYQYYRQRSYQSFIRFAQLSQNGIKSIGWTKTNGGFWELSLRTKKKIAYLFVSLWPFGFSPWWELADKIWRGVFARSANPLPFKVWIYTYWRSVLNLQWIFEGNTHRRIFNNGSAKISN